MHLVVGVCVGILRLAPAVGLGHRTPSRATFALIREAFESSDETYGYRRIHAQLARWGVPCGPELVRGIMRELGL